MDNASGLNAETVEVESIFGTITAFHDDLITQQIIDYGAHTRPELAMLLSVVKPGDVVFDIGAHIGTFGLPLAQAVGPGGKVVAVEGMTAHYDLLRHNIERLHLTDRMIALNCLIAPNGGYAFDTVTRNTGASYLRSSADDAVATPARSLDDIAEAHFVPDVIKIDIEGLEVFALAGAQLSLVKDPVIYCEVSQEQLARHGATVEALDTFFQARAYRLFRNVGERNARHDAFMVVELASLMDGGSFFDVLALHSQSARLQTLAIS